MRFFLPFLLATAVAGALHAQPSDQNDPYLWLEDVQGSRAMAWVDRENAKTLNSLQKDPRYPKLFTDALAVAQTKERIPTPRILSEHIFNFWQDADHVRGVWRKTDVDDYRATTPHWTTVLDVDALAKAEKANWFMKGEDCQQPTQVRCLISLSDGGEDAVTIREFDLTAGAFVRDGFMLSHGKQTAAWETPDSLIVAREWAAGDLTTSGYPFVVKRVRRGQPISSATEIFRGSPKDDGGVAPETFVDGDGDRVSLIEREVSTFESEKYLVTPTGVKRLALPLKSQPQELVQGRLVVSLDEDWAPNGTAFKTGSLISLDLAQLQTDPSRLKPTLIFSPGPRQSFAQASATKDRLIVTALDNVRGRAFVYRPIVNGWSPNPLDFPDNVSLAIVDADPRSDRAFLSTTGFLTPSTVSMVDAKTNAVQLIKTLPRQFDASKDTVEQFEAQSKDGTKVPYFVVHPKTMKLDSANPTILYAYGGFEVSETPTYSATLGKLWLERGGVYVLANIRGGGEFGPAWHEAGLKTHRQVIYDDFAAVAEDLIARKITSPRRLGIEGGSNGGLLMGVELTERPDLWRAVDIQVPLLDMLRYEKIAAGTSWVGEYGSVAVPAERAFLEKISPYNTLRPGMNYPEPFIWTTTKDDRVGPQHARKFAAKLAEMGYPYLYYEVTEGGHSAGADLTEKARTAALEMTYFTQKLMD